MGMLQAKGRASLVDKLLQVLGSQPRLEHLDGRQGIVVVDMLAQVDLAKAALSQKTAQPVLAKLLPNSFGHRSLPLDEIRDTCSSSCLLIPTVMKISLKNIAQEP